MDVVLNVVLTAAGIVMLCFGGHWLVGGGISVAKRFGISPMVIGITIVAMGTSTPELAASLAAGDNGEIILGNVVGSNIANIGMVIGVAAIMAPLIIKKGSLRIEIPVMIGFSVLLVALSVGGEISHLEGAVLVVLLITFTAYMYRSSRKKAVKIKGTPADKTVPKSVLLIGAGVALLGIGAILTIDNAEALAQSFGVSDRYIGLTVIAIGTSLPELITSVIAIRRGYTDIGIGNIIGSNIYNILMIVGISATLSGIVVAPQVFADYVVMIAFSMVMLVGLRMGRIGKAVGIGLLAGYLIYQFLTGIGAGIGYECCPL